jgi:hypothetical protein
MDSSFADVIPRTLLLAFWSCTVAFQSRDFLPCGFEFLVKLIDAIRKQLNGSAMSLPVKPHVRFGCCRGCLGFLTSMKIQEDERSTYYEEEAGKNDEQTEGEPQSRKMSTRFTGGPCPLSELRGALMRPSGLTLRDLIHYRP